MSSLTKHAAYEYILGPLNEPTPNEETGLGASFRVISPKQITPTETGTSTSTNPFRRSASERKNGPQVHMRSVSNPTGRCGSMDGGFRSRSGDQSRPSQQYLQGGLHRRSTSLRERYPGDPSVRPLDTLKQESKAANRSPHLRKHHRPGTDSIDWLDATSGRYRYHHEGPYDAALLSRNLSWNSSPIAALNHSNAETIKATPPENVKDSVERHRPLDGVALVPSGERDMYGRLYEYEEGSNMMIYDGADYKRWPGIKYHPDDIKGKGEPSYTIEKALKDHKKKKQGDATTYELIDVPRKRMQSIKVE